MKASLRLWKFNRRSGLWDVQRAVTDETADRWLAFFQKDEPNETFVVSKYDPRKPPKQNPPLDPVDRAIWDQILKRIDEGGGWAQIKNLPGGEDFVWDLILNGELEESDGFVRVPLKKNPAPPRAAIEMYAQFQGHEPRRLGYFYSGFKIPFAASLAGPAFNVMYRSDKNDPSTGKPVRSPIDYIHDHEKGVNVYRCDPKAGPADVAVPAFIRDVDSLVLLGDCLGFTYEDENGDAIEAAPTNPLPELYTIPSGRALVVVQSKRKVLALIWGGKLGVEARGIVY